MIYLCISPLNILKLAWKLNQQTIGHYFQLMENDHAHFQGLKKVRIKFEFYKRSSNLKKKTNLTSLMAMWMARMLSDGSTISGNHTKWKLKTYCRILVGICKILWNCQWEYRLIRVTLFYASETMKSECTSKLMLMPAQQFWLSLAVDTDVCLSRV